jgi:ABC-type branched-subunit amino acid transport system substrate-binding protein
MGTWGGDLLIYLYPTLEKLGWEGPILAGLFSSRESWLKGMELVKKIKENAYMYLQTLPPLDIATPGGDELIKAWKEFKGKFSPYSHHASGWVTAGVIASALERAGWPCSHSDLIKSLEKTDFDTKGLMGGNIKFSPTDHLGPQYTVGLKWDHINKRWNKVTDWIKVDPKEIAKVSDFVYGK